MTLIILYNNNIRIIDNNVTRDIDIGECYRFYHELKDGLFSVEIDTFEGVNKIMCHSNNVMVIDNRQTT